MVWLRELEWQLYLWLTQEGILLLICAYLSCSTSTPLSPFPLPMSSASLTLSSCTKKRFCWQRCYCSCLVRKVWWWWLEVWLHCCAAPGLAAVLILLSPASKQQEKEKAISELIPSPPHYQICSLNYSLLQLWLMLVIELLTWLTGSLEAQSVVSLAVENMTRWIVFMNDFKNVSMSKIFNGKKVLIIEKNRFPQSCTRML